MPEISKEWADWIHDNINAGLGKDPIFKILLDNGFEYEQIKQKLNHTPSFSTEHAKVFASDKKAAEVQIAGLYPESVYLPRAKKLSDNKAEIYHIEGFLSGQECEKVIAAIQNNMKPSIIIDQEKKEKAFRTSSTCNLDIQGDPFINMIDQRICKMIGIDNAFGETIQGQFYEVGQEFKAHTDFFEKNELPNHDQGYGQRTYTFFIYLNTVEEGGKTDFPRLGFSGVPKMGDAMIWNSLLPDGSVNYNTLHHGMPVIKGYKAVITKWFRLKSPLKPIEERSIKTDNEKITAYSDTGFAHAKLDKKIHQQILDLALKSQSQTDDKSNHSLELPPSLKTQIEAHIKPQLEKWAGINLTLSEVESIQTHGDKATISSHRNSKDSQIISCMMRISQDIDENWQFQIEDHFYRQHDIVFQAGDMLFYEGARLAHGREVPMNGRHVTDLLCHFVPK